MKITLRKFDTSHLTANEEALRRCEMALELKDRGDYAGVQGVMHPLWDAMGERPNCTGLHASVAAEVLLTVGILTCWISTQCQLKKAQETAKNLITESLHFFESIGDLKKVAAARSELAYCYWCEGELNEARTMFEESLVKLTTEGNTRARALLGLAVVEWSASRYAIALKCLTDNAALFNKITSYALKGAYHSQLAMVLRMLATPSNKNDNLQRAVAEYQKADHNFKLARNPVFRADVKNNVGNILRQLSRYKEAHKYLQEAKRLTGLAKDKARTAQIDDTRAQVFIAEKKFKEAEAVARNAVRILEKSGHQCLLADVLVTHGIALARLKRAESAQFAFQRAIEVAHQVGALNKAGIAALTMIEELEELSSDALYAAYDRASEWLTTSQSQDLLIRLNAAARKVVAKVRTSGSLPQVVAEDPIDAILNKPCDLQREVLKYEGTVIQRALAKANGSLTRAAAMLSMSYQALAYIIESRQPDLLKERTPIRRRSRRESAVPKSPEQIPEQS
jgi:tetratricopeptide (TPR) repeat protein